MTIQDKTIKPNADRQVYTRKTWIKAEIKKPIRADELFLVFIAFFTGVFVSVLMYLNR